MSVGGSALEERLLSLCRNRLVLVALVGFTVFKLALTGVLGSTADVPQMLSTARALFAGRDLLDLANTGGNPAYFLFGHSLIAAICLLVAQATGISFDVTIKVPAILSDLGVAFLLRAMPRGGDRTALLYMFNPLTFLLSVYHGQLHVVAVAGVVCAIWLMDRDRFVLGGGMLALAATVRQHWAALILPLAMGSVKRQNVILVTFALVLLLLNYPLLGSDHLDRLLAPMSHYGLWGYAMVFYHGPRVLSLAGFGGIGSALAHLNLALKTYGVALNWFWVAVFVIWVWRRRVDDQWHAALLFVLGIYSVGPGFGLQRLIWALPFWLIVNPREAIGYSTLAGALLGGSYWQWSLNAKYGVGSLTANLDLLTWGDLAGVFLVGALGFLTWVYCVRTAWRLANM